MQSTITPLNSTIPILFQKIVRKIVLNPLIAIGRFSLLRGLFAKNSLSQRLVFKSSWKLKLMSLLAMVMFGGGAMGQTTRYWKGSGTWTSANQWALSSGGAYTSTWVSNDIAVFNVASSVVTFASTGVTGIIANENVTFTNAGTLTTNGLQIPITVASGMILNLSGQAISTAAGTGFTKNGFGTLIIGSSGLYPGGFTLNAGTMQVGGVNALGSGGALNLNGGILTASTNSNRD